jgi:hypothetical protein
MLLGKGAANRLRFHSLPASKRYADTDEERSLLLGRQKVLALEVLGDQPCWLVQAHWVLRAGEREVADPHDPFRATREWNLAFAFEILEDDGEEGRPWRVYAAEVRWAPGRFDELLLSIADEKAGPTLWMGADGAIFAPYDGGVDLFLPDAGALQRLAAQHPDWLPTHPLNL